MEDAEPMRSWALMPIFDYIIIGGGSAGCVLANRLSENPGHRVLLLEAGVEDRSPTLHVPALVIATRKYNWKYTALPDVSRNGLIDRWSAGKVLGGSSSINGMMFVRGNRLDFDNWARLGCTGWDYESVLPYFKAIENFEKGGNAFRGHCGPQNVSFSRAESPVTELFIEAARNCGYVYNEDYNAQRQEGVSHVQGSQARGRRWSTARAFLAPARKRPNLEIRTRSMASRIVIENGRAVGVEYQRGGKSALARCTREVIVCAGAIGSPKLLMLSGIGPADHLRDHGIEVLIDRPDVGGNLMEHPAIWVTADVNVPTFNAENRLHRHLINGFRWLWSGRGPAAAGVAQAQVFSHTRPGFAAPNMQLVFTPVSWSMNHAERSLLIPKRNAISVAAVVLQPKGRGRLRLASKDVHDSPIVDHQLLGDADDAQQLVEGVRQVVQILRAQPLRNIIEKVTRPTVVDGPDDELLAELRGCAFRGDHPSGTCRMGGDEGAVLDARLRVRGVEGLRVADASIMPTVTNGNTNAPTIMIGQKASEMILEDAPISNGGSSFMAMVAPAGRADRRGRTIRRNSVE